MIINETNETTVKPCMVFHVRLTLQDVHAKTSRSIIAVGETVIINQEGTDATIVTSGIQRKYTDISYSLEDDEDEEMKENGGPEADGKSVSSEDSANMSRNVNRQNLTEKRLRQKNIMQHADQEQRKRS